METETEKIYCCDRSNDNVLAASILANSRRDDNSWPMMAAMGGGFNQWMNNPFAYMMMMAFMRNFGWGGEGYGYGQGQQNIEMQNQLQAIRTQLSDNHNADCIKGAIHGVEGDVRQLAQTLGCDYNTMMQVLGDVRTQLALFGEKIGCSAERVSMPLRKGMPTSFRHCRTAAASQRSLSSAWDTRTSLGRKTLSTVISADLTGQTPAWNAASPSSDSRHSRTSAISSRLEKGTRSVSSIRLTTTGKTRWAAKIRTSRHRFRS